MTNTLKYEVEKYWEEFGKYFDNSQADRVKSMIINSDKSMSEIKSLKLKSPITATVLSVCLGWIGIDRFYSGNYVWAVIKLFTCGLCFIGWLADITIIGKSVKNQNYNKMHSFITGQETQKNININTDTIKNIVNNQEVRDAAKDLVKAHREIMNSMDPDNN